MVDVYKTHLRLLECPLVCHGAKLEESVLLVVVVMDDRNAVLKRFSPLKDLSAEQLVTGSVHSIVTNALMLGYIELACLTVTTGVDGKANYIVRAPVDVAPT